MMVILSARSLKKGSFVNAKAMVIYMKAKWFGSLVRRRFFMVLFILLQLAVMIITIAERSMASAAFNGIMRLLSLIVCLNVASKDGGSAFKLTWVYIILIFPVFGGLFYIFFKFQSPTGKFKKAINNTINKANNLDLSSVNCYNDAVESFPEWKNQIHYLGTHNNFPVYENTKAVYLSPGEKKFELLLEELKKAEKYIFLEYFIISEGTVWESIVDILEEKAKSGVDVRVMYDDMGCFLMIPRDFKKQLTEKGIKCTVFNPFVPVLKTVQNNRDHRKIVVIDGKTAFTGGINLADYYMNIYPKYGHWKDSAIMLKGAGATGFAVMFLQMWELATGACEDYSKYLCLDNKDDINVRGYVQPYSDSPMDEENVGEHVYLNILNNAKKYVYITTPYLIIDDNMLSSLCLAAKNGVDLRIVTPCKWDKWAIHMTTRSYYKTLIQAGVKVYEYTPGFIHSKTFVADDTIATVGSANMDFRSLYLHFECGTVLYGNDAVASVKEDSLKTFELSRLITLDDCKCGFLMSVFRKLMRIFAPLL